MCPPPISYEKALSPSVIELETLGGNRVRLGHEAGALLTELSEWVKSLSRVQLFVTPWTVAAQAPPSMGFSRQEYWSGLLAAFKTE